MERTLDTETVTQENAKSLLRFAAVEQRARVHGEAGSHPCASGQNRAAERPSQLEGVAGNDLTRNVDCPMFPAPALPIGEGLIGMQAPYSAEFEQKLIDRGVYPDGYRAKDGAKPPKPANMKEIREALAQARSSLSPSQVSGEAFEEFQDNNRRAKSESIAMADVIPMTTGVKDRQFETAEDIPFDNLQRFDSELSVPKSDKYYSARPDQIDKRVCDNLAQYIRGHREIHMRAPGDLQRAPEGA